MFAFLIRRLGISLVIVWGVLTTTFLLLHLAPGDPASLYLRPEIDAETLARIRHDMGLDRPLWQQYWLWGREFVQGNFGVSFSQQRPVREIFAEAIPNTLQLTVAAFVAQFLIGLLLGILSAMKHGRLLDRVLSGVTLFVYSMPGFWLALMAIMIFSFKLGWLPSSQMQSLVPPEGMLAAFGDRLYHLLLPAAVLAAPFAAYTARFLRSGLLNTMEQPFMLTAEAYGLPRWQIWFKYALKNAALPLVSLFGVYLPFLLGGAVITEHIFAWPGIGRITVQAIFAHDFPVVLASNFIAAAAVVSGNLLSDVLAAVIDPRIAAR